MAAPAAAAAATASRRAALAVAYAAGGWAVFPLYEVRRVGVGWRCACGRACGRDAGKHPRVAGGLSVASADAITVRAWWHRWPHANIGIAASASGLVILDVDGRHDGFASLRQLEARLGALPDAPTVLTGGDGGGEHRYFRAPASVAIRPSSGELATGIDVRAGGSYVVGAGSRHGSGRLYAWAVGCEPDALPLPALPAAWIARLADHAARRAPLDAGAPIPETTRNSTLTRLAGAMRRYGFDAAAIEAALVVTNHSRCRPPLPDADVSTIAASVGRYAPAAFRPAPRVPRPRVLEA